MERKKKHIAAERAEEDALKTEQLGAETTDFEQEDEAIPEIEKLVGRKIKLLRQLAGMNQSEVASLLGVTFQQLQKYETGKNKTPVDKLLKLSQIFKVKMEVFFEDSMKIMFDKSGKIIMPNITLVKSVKEEQKTLESATSEDEKDLVKYFKTIESEAVKKDMLKLMRSLAKKSEE